VAPSGGDDVQHMDSLVDFAKGVPVVLDYYNDYYNDYHNNYFHWVVLDAV
jgi:hypothetical protein